MSEPAARVLVVDDDQTFRLSTAALLRHEGYEVTAAASAQEAVQRMQLTEFDLILLDLRMPGLDGIALAEVLRQRGHGVPILMISGVGTVSDAVAALHTGIDDFLTKPAEPDVLAGRVAALLARRPRAGAESAVAAGGLIGRSPAMRHVYDAIRRVAPSETTVLVTGETGTGKELVARAIHELSPRNRAPFVVVNCAALAEGVLESELFGHVRGAFTGAVRDKTGLFSSAAGGTVFLDEIGDVTPGVQQRLLRVLQEKEVLPVGALRPLHLDARVIAATNQDLRAAMTNGDFREDLFYRLNVFRIAMPPLRERRGDIPLLIEWWLDGWRARSPRADRVTCSPFAMRLLQAYDWPGNVRELLSVLESAVLRTDSGRLEAQHLPAEVRGMLDDATHGRYQSGDVAGGDERAAIVAALARAEGIRGVAADLLGMGRTTLWRKMKKYGLEASMTPDGDAT